MSIPQILEVAIGLIFVYYVLGSIVSLFTQWINEGQDARGRALEESLKKIVGENTVGDFVKLPQLEALRPIRYKKWYSVFKAEIEPKMIEKIPVATLVDAYFDLARFTTNTQLNPEKINELIDNLPDSESKQAFKKWVEQGVTSVDELRKRTTTYFAGLMEQASATFRSKARSFVITLSILLTLGLGTDSIDLFWALWENAEFRAVIVATAEYEAQQGVPARSIADSIQDLRDLNIGWWRMTLPESSEPLVWIQFVLLKVLGLGLTAAAVSQGSSFWYDLLKRLTSPTKGLGGGGGGSSSEEKG
jgi:hypothetical protein